MILTKLPSLTRTHSSLTRPHPSLTRTHSSLTRPHIQAQLTAKDGAAAEDMAELESRHNDRIAEYEASLAVSREEVAAARKEGDDAIEALHEELSEEHEAEVGTTPSHTYIHTTTTPSPSYTPCLGGAHTTHTLIA